MSYNPLRDLQANSRDIRQIGSARIPINIQRACVIFINTFAYRNNASLFQAITVAKLAKWANCEIYFICEASVSEFTEILTHFSQNVIDLCLFYYAGNPISQDLMDSQSSLKLTGGTIGPDLFYETIDNNKKENNKIIILFDGVNQTDPWDPKKQELQSSNILFMAPTPSPASAHLTQFDLQNQSIFLTELKTALKAEPTISANDAKVKIAKAIQEFGMNVFLSSWPENFASKPLIV